MYVTFSVQISLHRILFVIHASQSSPHPCFCLNLSMCDFIYAIPTVLSSESNPIFDVVEIPDTKFIAAQRIIAPFHTYTFIISHHMC